MFAPYGRLARLRAFFWTDPAARSAPAPAFAPQNAKPPAITSWAEEGTPIVCNEGGWVGNPTFAYEWIQVGVGAIPGATKRTYTPVAGDIGKQLYCLVTATNAQGSTQAASNITSAVTAAN